MTTSSGARQARRSLVSLLAETGIASEAELRRAVVEAHEQGLRLGELIVARGWLDEDAMARLLAEQWGLPFLGRESLAIDPIAAGLLPFELARALGSCVVGIRDGGPLAVVADPTTERLNALRAHLDGTVVGASASFAVVTASSLERLHVQLARIHHSKTAVDHTTAVPALRPAEPATETTGETALERTTNDRLLDQLRRAASAEAALRARIDQLERDRGAAQEQLDSLRRQLERAERQRALDDEEVGRLLADLDVERERLHDLERRLAELLAQLDPTGRRGNIRDRP
jgi:MshEN domain